jgi:hypothetical protein
VPIHFSRCPSLAQRDTQRHESQHAESDLVSKCWTSYFENLQNPNEGTVRAEGRPELDWLLEMPLSRDQAQ